MVTPTGCSDLGQRFDGCEHAQAESSDRSNAGGSNKSGVERQLQSGIDKRKLHRRRRRRIMAAWQSTVEAEAIWGLLGAFWSP